MADDMIFTAKKKNKAVTFGKQYLNVTALS